ncbi:hypothetical protein A9Q84_15530 [Halobacteriovorax marinus]|uniref:Uncharacterized protein n=1 Tax=Halobacteriovorax marinus TaxID=97084 RepID=A0A1Y5FAB0_9BACT|nr:hypothetical protein A9Q84_15530 [Halobacteriovorax marinus]
MKRILIIFFILCTSVFAEIKVPDIQKIATAIGQNVPNTIQGSEFNITIPVEGDFELLIKPEDAFQINKISSNSFIVKIIESTLLYDNLGGFYEPKFQTLDYEVKQGGGIDIIVDPTILTDCVQVLEFKKGPQTINFDSLSQYYTFRFIFDSNILKKLSVEGTKATFKRLKSGEATVKLVMTRRSNGVEFVAESDNLQECSVNTPNPVDGDWSDYSEYGQCSKTCGGGIQRWRRSCTNPAPANGGKKCSGSTFSNTQCNTRACPVVINGGWSEWSAPGKCTEICGGGIQLSRRTCTSPRPSNGGNSCSGLTTLRSACNEMRCIPRHLSKKQKDFFEDNAVTINIDERHTRLFSKKFNFDYTATLSNPYHFDIRCDVKITSYMYDGHPVVVDSKSHPSITVPAGGSRNMSGNIKCKRTDRDSGVSWIDRDHMHALNCRILNSNMPETSNNNSDDDYDGLEDDWGLRF